MTAPPTAPHSGGGTLAIREGQAQFTPTQRAALAQIGVADASDADLAVFLHYCQRTGLDPFSKQIYMIKRQGKQTIQTGIDGFRLIAQRTREYEGRVSTEWCGVDGNWRDVWLGGPGQPPFAARVVVQRKGHSPISSVCLYDEYVGRKYSGEINDMWSTKPSHMIAKCAEAAALRAAFPNDLAGLYTDDEMMAADNPVAGPALPNTIDMEPEPPTANGIDWEAMIAERVTAAAADPATGYTMLKSLLAQARDMAPGQGALLNKIASAMQAAKAKIPEDPPAPAGSRDPNAPKPATPRMKGAIATLITKAGVSGREGQHLVAARLAERGNVLLSFDHLLASEAATIIDTLSGWDKAGTLAAEVNALVPDEDDAVWQEIAAAREATKNAGN